MKVTVAYYGIGNLLSVERAFAHCGAEVEIATKPEQIRAAERIVVPGVGAFKKCMEKIDSHQMRDALVDFARSGRPYLGICVGMQMLLEKSYEFGEHEGLGLFEGYVSKLNVPEHAVPFIGWKKVNVLERENQFYFVHSYHAQPVHGDDVFCSYTLGTERIVAAVKRDNVIGVQFHPEKSATDGIHFLKYFLESVSPSEPW